MSHLNRTLSLGNRRRLIFMMQKKHEREVDDIELDDKEVMQNNISQTAGEMVASPKEDKEIEM